MKSKVEFYNAKKGKKSEFIYNGNAEEAFDKFCERKVFGEYIVFAPSIKMYDADTRGKKWIEAIDDPYRDGDINTINVTVLDGVANG